MPQSLADVAALLLATGTMKENHPETLLITMSMGRTGCVSRLCGGLFGSVMGLEAWESQCTGTGISQRAVRCVMGN